MTGIGPIGYEMRLPQTRHIYGIQREKNKMLLVSDADRRKSFTSVLCTSVNGLRDQLAFTVPFCWHWSVSGYGQKSSMAMFNKANTANGCLLVGQSQFSDFNLITNSEWIGRRALTVVSDDEVWTFEGRHRIRHQPSDERNSESMSRRCVDGCHVTVVDVSRTRHEVRDTVTTANFAHLTC